MCCFLDLAYYILNESLLREKASFLYENLSLAARWNQMSSKNHIPNVSAGVMNSLISWAKILLVFIHLHLCLSPILLTKTPNLTSLICTLTVFRIHQKQTCWASDHPAAPGWCRPDSSRVDKHNLKGYISAVRVYQTTSSYICQKIKEWTGNTNRYNQKL